MLMPRMRTQAIARAMAETTKAASPHEGLKNPYRLAPVIAAPAPKAMYHHFGLKKTYVPNPTTKVSRATMAMKVASQGICGIMTRGCSATSA